MFTVQNIPKDNNNSRDKTKHYRISDNLLTIHLRFSSETLEMARKSSVADTSLIWFIFLFSNILQMWFT